jgi:hypothetical protein
MHGVAVRACDDLSFCSASGFVFEYQSVAHGEEFVLTIQGLGDGRRAVVRTLPFLAV